MGAAWLGAEPRTLVVAASVSEAPARCTGKPGVAAQEFPSEGHPMVAWWNALLIGEFRARFSGVYRDEMSPSARRPVLFGLAGSPTRIAAE